MSDLVPLPLPLGLGLDLESNKLAAHQGTLKNCLNYDITDTQGLHRIDGYEPYDARMSPASYTYIAVSTNENTGWTNGTYLVARKGDGVVLAGVVVDVPGSNLFVIAVNSLDFVSPDAFSVALSAYDMASNGPDTEYIANIVAYSSSEIWTDTEDHYAALRENAHYLRSQISDLGYPAVGLHWFNSRAYAIAPPKGVKAVIPGWTPSDGTNIDLYYTDGYTLTNDYNSAEALIVDSTGVQYPDGDLPYVYYSIIPTVGTYDDWQEAVDNGATINVEASVGDGTPLQLVALYSDINSRVGTLWTCKDVETAYKDEDSVHIQGWVPQETCWLLGFDGGTTSSGDPPPALERKFGEAPNTSATYYISNNANGCTYSFELVSIFVPEDTGGDWAGADAAGVMQIRNLQLLTPGDGIPIDPDEDQWVIYSDPSLTIAIADATTFAYGALPLKNQLEENESQYRFITHNFYADDGWDGMYGVNGAGRAFYLSGGLFAFIFTHIDDDIDKPRHVAAHMDTLALGYKQGAVLMSAVGEPHNFRGVDGAQEHGMGDRVTGLASLNGTALGVFCEQSIRSIVGVAGQVEKRVIAPETGCIEYTLDTVYYPVFCNASGIFTVEQSDLYGDFYGRPLSYKVNKWLRPRLRRYVKDFSDGGTVLRSYVVRSKNQYRLCFKDGSVLTMTLNDPQVGEFTFQKYTVRFITPEGVQGTGPFVPLAVCSVIDNYGEEHLLASSLDTRIPAYSTYVFELDKGWGFAGQPVPHFFETNWLFTDQNKYFTVQKVRMYGLTHGVASLKIQASGIQDNLKAEYHDTVEDISLPESMERYSVQMYDANSSMADLANRGLGVQLKISNTNNDTMEPAHVCQVLMLGINPQGATDA